MNRSVINRCSPRSWCCAMLAGLALLSWAWPVAGGEKQPVQSVAITVAGTSGETSVTPGGTVHIKGLTAVYMTVSDNPLTTGRLTVTGNFNGDLAMHGVGSGPAVFEVGTWDLSSGAPVFKAADDNSRYVSRWEFKGVLGGVGSLKAVGHGITGEVEGMVYSVEGQSDGSVTTYTGWLLDPKD